MKGYYVIVEKIHDIDTTRQNQLFSNSTAYHRISKERNHRYLCFVVFGIIVSLLGKNPIENVCLRSPIDLHCKICSTIRNSNIRFGSNVIGMQTVIFER